MKYYLLVPAVLLLGVVVYLFFLYAPNPSKNSNNGASVAPGELKQIGAPEIETTTVADSSEFKEISVALPSAEESSNEVLSNEESQAGVVASVEESSSESALSEETESMVSVVSAADDNTTEVTTEETALAAAVDDSTEEPITSAAVDGPAKETITPAAVEESIDDSSTDDIPAKRVTYVRVGSFDSPQADSSAGDDTRETVSPQPEVQSQSVAADDQPQLSGGYIEHQSVITSSLSRATSDAGLSANQSARIGKIFKPYLDLRRELRKGDKLTILLDPGAAKTGNDAEQIHRIEFHGARKNLVVTRKEGSLSDYEVRNADGEMLSGKDFQATMAVEKPRREASVEPAPRRVANNNTVTGNMKRLESAPGMSSDAHNGDDNSSVRKPFWRRLGFGSSNGDKNSSARKPFWKRLGFGSSSAEEGGN